MEPVDDQELLKTKPTFAALVDITASFSSEKEECRGGIICDVYRLEDCTFFLGPLRVDDEGILYTDEDEKLRDYVISTYFSDPEQKEKELRDITMKLRFVDKSSKKLQAIAWYDTLPYNRKNKVLQYIVSQSNGGLVSV